MADKFIQCEGWRRYGGAFTLGPVRWEQCDNEAVVTISVKQGEEAKKDYPACMTCWAEMQEKADDDKTIKIYKVTPIKKKEEEDGKEKSIHSRNSRPSL